MCEPSPAIAGCDLSRGERGSSGKPHAAGIRATNASSMCVGCHRLSFSHREKVARQRRMRVRIRETTSIATSRGGELRSSHHQSSINSPTLTPTPLPKEEGLKSQASRRRHPRHQRLKHARASSRSVRPERSRIAAKSKGERDPSTPRLRRYAQGERLSPASSPEGRGAHEASLTPPASAPSTSRTASPCAILPARPARRVRRPAFPGGGAGTAGPPAIRAARRSSPRRRAGR